jgi:hypothetical protein
MMGMADSGTTIRDDPPREAQDDDEGRGSVSCQNRYFLVTYSVDNTCPPMKPLVGAWIWWSVPLGWFACVTPRKVSISTLKGCRCVILKI